MAIEGELEGTHHDTIRCEDCGQDMPRSVCQSAAGYYIGYYCDNCGPWSRETDYFRTRAEAQAALDKNGAVDHLRSTAFNGA